MKRIYLFRRKLFLSIVCLMACYTALHAQIDWTQYSGNPVLDLGPASSWDAGTVFEHFVIKSGDTLKMWYSGNDASQIFENDFGIGYAWSLDGINWTRHASNPVMVGRTGKWDNIGVAAPAIVQDGDTLRMWYHAVTVAGAVPGKLIGYATSIDGVNWTRLDAPVLEAGASGEWDADILIAHAVVKDGDTYKMWYSGGTGAPPNVNFRIGYATSPDGVNWTKYDDPATTASPFQFSDPVIERGSSGSFDDGRAFTPHVLKTVSGYEMWYTGAGSANEFNQVIMYATSTDGINWTKHAGNPVLQVSKSWTQDITTPRVIRDGEQFRMWFNGFEPNFPFPARLGYATAPLTTSVDEKDRQTGIPFDFVLHQNYPNPFNPATKIRYEVSNPTRVVLKIMNLLGQEVRTLVNEEKLAGFYEVQWDGKDRNGQRVASGVYLYRLEAQALVQTRKMVLLQ